MAEVLKQLKDNPERASYILMDVIQPPLLQNWMIRPGTEPMLVDTLSELGIFGVIIGYNISWLLDSANNVLNESLHHIVSEMQRKSYIIQWAGICCARKSTPRTKEEVGITLNIIYIVQCTLTVQMAFRYVYN